MALVTVSDLRIGFGNPLLFDGAYGQLERGERVVLLGRNGSGKSTLLRALMGDVSLSGGSIFIEPGTRVGFLGQATPSGLEGSVFEVVAGGLAEHALVLEEFHAAALEVSRHGGSDVALVRLERAQQEVTRLGAWELSDRVNATIKEVGLDPDEAFETLSGGRKRKALLARALVSGPDLLLLDEPTNHLDSGSITWLESKLLRFEGTILLVTHDRALVRRVATKILEVDRGRLKTWNCDYDTYVVRKAAELEEEANRWQAQDKKIAEEQTWASGGLKARRTRNEGRVRALRLLEQQREERRERVGAVRLTIQEAQRPGDMVMEARGLSFRYGASPIISGFSTRIVRGERIGILGPNGSGKTTLLRLLLGELSPEEGVLRHGSGVEPLFFDQLRAMLDPSRTIGETVGEGQDIFDFGGKPIHIYAYLDRFLFGREQANVHIGDLSGGERARVALALLFRRPCNLLVLDEPTNDLDIETLELLEQLLIEYPGTLLVVSHDREFLNNVVTSTLVMEPGGKVVEYAGGYDDWARVVERREAEKRVVEQRQLEERRVEQRQLDSAVEESQVRVGARKLTMREAKELEGLEGRIAEVESGIALLDERLNDPDVYRGSPPPALALQQERLQLKESLDGLYERWSELEAIKEEYHRRK